MAKIPWFAQNIETEPFVKTLYHWDFDVEVYKTPDEFLERVKDVSISPSQNTPFLLTELAVDNPCTDKPPWDISVGLIRKIRKSGNTLPIFATDITNGYGQAREDAILAGATDVIQMIKKRDYITPLEFAEKLHKFYEYIQA